MESALNFPPGDVAARVSVALCDNKSRIVPVGEKIGNGDNPDTSLLGLFRWPRLPTSPAAPNGEPSPPPRTSLRPSCGNSISHIDGNFELIAEACRGSEIKKCLEDFEKAHHHQV